MVRRKRRACVFVVQRMPNKDAKHSIRSEFQKVCIEGFVGSTGRVMMIYKKKGVFDYWKEAK